MNIDKFEISNIVNSYKIYERMVFELSDTIAFTEDNFKTYSLKLNILLLSICSFIENTAKLFCCCFDKNFKIDSNFLQIKTTMFQISSSIKNEEIEFFGSQLSPIKPWDNTDWWSDYNKNKHQSLKKENLKKANLKNVIFALGALYVIVFYLAATPLIEFEKNDNLMLLIQSKNIRIKANSGFYSYFMGNSYFESKEFLKHAKFKKG